jgi:hypothetical protein
MPTKLKLKGGIPKAWQDQLKALRAYAAPPGTEDVWKRHVEATMRRLEETYVFEQLGDLLDKTPEDSDERNEIRKLWKQSGERYDRLMRTELGTFDAWNYKVKHLNDKKASPIEEVRFAAIETLTANVGVLQFNIKPGLLGSKLAQAIHKDTVEVELADPPLCPDCG